MTIYDSGLSKAPPRALIPMGVLVLASLQLFGCGEQLVGFPAEDRVAPTVVVSTPDEGADGVALNRTLSVRFSEEMRAGSLDESSFTLSRGSVEVAGTVTYVGLTASFAPDANLEPSTIYTGTVRASVVDLAGNHLASDFTWTFTTGTTLDTLRPLVVLLAPGDMDTDVSINASVAVVFSEPIDPASFEGATFTLTQGIASLGGTVTVFGATVFFDPDNDLLFNTEYSVRVTTAAADLAGNTLLTEHEWTFRTALDEMPPRVILSGPSDLASSVRRDTVVSATFSEAMDASSVLASFSMRDPDDMLVDGSLTFDAPSQTLRFVPSDPLLANTTYSVIVSADATNLLGVPLALASEWSFTTGSQALGVQPLNLGSLWSFVAVAGAGLTNSNSSGTTVLDGDVGLFPGISCLGDGVDCTGVNPVITGTLFAADAEMVAERAKLDLTAAYVDAMTRAPGTTVSDLGGMTLEAGVYTSGSTMNIAVGGILTLDGGGDPDAVFIFQIGSSLTVGNDAEVLLINGARARNVFWVAFASSTLGSGVSFQGNVLAGASNSVGTDSTVVGRLLCSTGEISLLSNTITLPL